jgi:hypothetical protein
MWTQEVPSTNILLDFNAKVQREDSLKPTTENESLQEIRNNNIRVQILPIQKNLNVKSTKFPNQSIQKYTWTSLGGKTNNQTDHNLTYR